MTGAATPIGPDSRFRRSFDTSWSRLGDEVLVLDLARRRSHRLLETATFIWLRCIDGEPLSVIGADLAAAYEVSPERALADVTEIVGSWLEVGIVERA